MKSIAIRERCSFRDLQALAWCLVMLSVALGCQHPQSGEEASPVLKMDLSDRSEFANHVFVSPHQAFPSDPDTFSDTVQKVTEVQVDSPSGQFAIKCELIVLDLSRDGKMRIHLNSTPMSLEDSYQSALEACNAVSVENKKFKDWWAKKGYTRIGASVQHNGGDEEYSATVQMRSSLETELPWRVRVEINTRISKEEAERLFSRVVRQDDMPHNDR